MGENKINLFLYLGNTVWEILAYLQHFVPGNFQQGGQWRPWQKYLKVSLLLHTFCYLSAHTISPTKTLTPHVFHFWLSTKQPTCWSTRQSRSHTESSWTCPVPWRCVWHRLNGRTARTVAPRWCRRRDCQRTWWLQASASAPDRSESPAGNESWGKWDKSYNTLQDRQPCLKSNME